MKRFLTAVLLLAPPALADVTTPSGAVVDCYCTDSSGARVELEEVICLYVDGRAFMARCEMSLNNPMWRPTGDACVSSSLIERLKPLLDARPVHPKI